MMTKDEIVKDWLPRYTGCPLNEFGEYILLTNFSRYLKLFAEWNNVEIKDPTASGILNHLREKIKLTSFFDMCSIWHQITSCSKNRKCRKKH